MEIIINSISYKIVFDEHMLDREEIRGDCDFNRQKIRIASQLDTKTKKNTILHEVLHAILEETGLKETFDWDETREHLIINILTAQLCNIYELKLKDGTEKEEEL